MSVKSATTQVDAKAALTVTDLKQALKEKASELLESQKYISLEETTKATIHTMESQLQELKKIVELKDLELQQYVQQKDLLHDQAQIIEQLNEEIRKHKHDLAEASSDFKIDATTGLVHSREKLENKENDELAQTKAELEKRETELAALAEELTNLQMAQKHDDVTVKSASTQVDAKAALTVTDLEQALKEKAAELLVSQKLNVSLEETTKATIHKMELQLQELKKIVELKDLELQQYVQQKDLLHDQAQIIEQLNEEIRKHEHDLPVASSDFKINATTGLVQSRERLENKESDELDQTKAELEKKEMELVVLEEELANLREAQKHDNMSVKSATTQVDAKAALTVTDLEQALKEKSAEPLESQKLNVSLEETTKATIHKMELQLQELKKIVELKDLELQQYVQQKDLLHDQAQIIEQLNEEIRKLKHDLAEASSDFKINATTGLVHSREKLENKENDELVQTKAELEKKEMELVVLEEELSKLRGAQKHDDITVNSSPTQINVDKAAVTVADLEKALKEKAAEILESEKLNVSLKETNQAIIHKMELQLQELQKVVEQKDLELQQYVQKKDQQTKEVEQLKEIIGTLKQELAQSVSDVHSREAIVHCENVLPRKTALERELMQTEAELEKAKTDLAVLKEELSKVRLTEIYNNVNNGNTSREGEAPLKVTDLEQALREKTAELLESQAMLVSLDETTQATIHSLESNLQELQKTIQLKDSELLQYVNQKGLTDQQTKEIERLKNLVSMNLQNLEDTSPDAMKAEEKSRQALSEKELLLQNMASLEGSELMQTKAELERTKIKLAAMSEEMAKIRLYQKNEDMPDGNTPIEGEVGNTAHKVTNLEQALREKTADLLASQTLLISLEETSQATIHNMESQLQELKKAVQLKDSELLQYLNQQNILNQQTKELEHLSGVIDSLQKQLGEAQQKTSVQESKSKKLEKELTEQMNGGEMTFIGTLDVKAEQEYEEPFGHLYSAQERIHTLDSGKRMSDGDVTAVMENKDQCDWMIEALRDQNTQLLANQSLFTSMQETMQSTIDSLETQLEELQKVIKEKDMEILLYLEEIEILKEQAKVKTDDHDQIMLAMEDSLREKVAAALVSEAQLKAIQLHTKCMHADDRSSPLMEESKILQTHVPNLSQEGEPESKSATLNLQLLELEKQLSDLHEQLQVERDQVIFTNQLAAEKEKQVVELQQLLKSPKGKQSITWATAETRDVAQLQISEPDYQLRYLKQMHKRREKKSPYV